MILKEYRILLPLSVEEYRIAQLYMIAKKSRQDTSGAGSGVEIIKNEPYEQGPGGKGGQYTYKIFHIGNHLPAWFRGILPKTALQVEEEAWNAYPYTKTRYTCPFVEKLLLEVETRYYNDAGTQDNVFNLNKRDMEDRIIDYMDIVKDPISVMEYCKEEDPKLYYSEKTGRGPLEDDWVDDCVKNNKPIMCAYKLCRVEFRYWGMQSRIEKFIHDIALRKTMVRAHRQAWAWQDEWYGLTIEDIRRMESETQQMLNDLMRKALLEQQGGLTPDADAHIPSVSVTGPSPEHSTASANGTIRRPVSPTSSLHSAHQSVSASSSSTIKDRFEAIRSDSDDSQSVYFDAIDMDQSPTVPHKGTYIRWSSVEGLNELEQDDELTPPSTPTRQTARSADDRIALLLLVLHGGTPLDTHQPSFNNKSSSYFATDANATKIVDLQTLRATVSNVLNAHYPNYAKRVAVQLVPCANFAQTALNTLASLSPYGGDLQSALSDGVCHPSLVSMVATDSRAYEDALHQATVKANHVYDDFMASEDGHNFNGEVWMLGDALGGLLAYDMLVRLRKPAVSRHASSVSNHSDVSAIIPEAQELDDNYPCTSTTPTGMAPPGSDRRSSTASTTSDNESECSMSSVKYALRLPHEINQARLSPSSPMRRSLRSSSREDRATSNGHHSHQSSSSSTARIAFKVSNLFLCGTPLGVVLMQRTIAHMNQYEPLLSASMNNSIPDTVLPDHPVCEQVYNLYYPMDPCAARIEPLLCRHWQRIAPMNVPRYCRFPLGDGQSTSMIEYARRHRDELLAAISCDPSVSSGSHVVLNSALRDWWGTKRLDYALYCPEGLAQFPVCSLPTILHGSYWESTDVVSFILRQFVLGDESHLNTPAQVVSYASESSSVGNSPISSHFPLRQNLGGGSGDLSTFTPSTPIEKWSRRRTSFKIKNAQANHRANDVILSETQPQILTARFMYGPLDVVALTGERVDVYVRSSSVCFLTDSGAAATKQSSTGSVASAPLDASRNSTLSSSSAGQQWVLIGTDVTDSSGRLVFHIPDECRLGLGVHAVKMVVRGDHTYLDMYCAVIPPDTQAVVFSIDGSFTASVSVSGKDPKVRPGAVDVVRHWQDLGYLILYITARPDMQQRQVVSWLAQHNFPHGLLFFTGGISTDPLRHKTLYLQKLVHECAVLLKVGYGSNKDIHVYSASGLPSDRIFVIGKCGKKAQALAQCLTDGYAQHLVQLSSGNLQGIAQPAQGNGRILLRKGYFSVPGQFYRVAVAVQRSQSFTPRSGKYSTKYHTDQPAAVHNRLHWSASVGSPNEQAVAVRRPAALTFLRSISTTTTSIKPGNNNNNNNTISATSTPTTRHHRSRAASPLSAWSAAGIARFKRPGSRNRQVKSADDALEETDHVIDTLVEEML